MTAHETPIHRAPMRARERDDVPAGAGAEYGVEHGVVGIGDTDERRIARFAELPDGTFVWTRDEDGAYHLGQIAGPCRRAPAAATRETGLTHVRDTRWLPRRFGPDEVPAGVAATFARGGRNLQRTHDPAAEARTRELWEA